MMKRFAILMLFALLVACSDELPPSPPPPGQVGVGAAIAGLAGAMPSWAAEARNTAITPSQAYYNDGVILSISNFDYIYSNGYFFNAKSRVWERFNLQGEMNKDWVKGQAVASIPVSPDKFAEGDNYLVVYGCTKVGGQWDCNNRRWMLVAFKVLGFAGGQIPESANIDQFVVNRGIPPFAVIKTGAEYDVFEETTGFDEIKVVRYDAQYREPNGLVVLVHVFDFASRQDVDDTVFAHFAEIIRQGWKVHQGHNVALFLGENDHRVATWTSGKEIIYVETFKAESASKEIIDEYLRKYPSDLKKV
ncbi:hypothetical protein C4580_00530 [Candidatus Woesearchaeota archaeon]|nr:MAG: hypothetical protein C4580_00530 [Candidatus Woesearchaeota archaeon]